MNNKYLFFGHHKCATRYIINILNIVNKYLELNHIEFHNDELFNSNLENIIIQKNLDFVYYTNAKYKHITKIDSNNILNYKGFHLIRDPRDILISAYFSHKNSHPVNDWTELKKIKNKLSSVSLSEGIKYEMSLLKENLIDLEKWNYSNPNIYEVKFEDLIKNPVEIIIDIFVYLDLVDFDYFDESIKNLSKELINSISNKLIKKKPIKTKKIPLTKLLNAIVVNDFKRLSNGRSNGIEDKFSHYRKGISGDWKNYFNNDIKEKFKTDFPNLLIKLGYEESNEW